MRASQPVSDLGQIPDISKFLKHAHARQGLIASAYSPLSKNATVQRVSASGGCGNNWGKGSPQYQTVIVIYSHVVFLLQGFAAAADLGPPTLDALRREMEAADCIHGMFVYHSLAGGTGSGLGSAITQVVRLLPFFSFFLVV